MSHVAAFLGVPLQGNEPWGSRAVQESMTYTPDTSAGPLLSRLTVTAFTLGGA